MKLRNILYLLPLGLSGCAGYNNTMFMTKSNVGLDFDSKPPTLEINVSRKEAVIAPSFEGGQTPPVMASFRPHAGTGSAFTSFFMGVDQTFAGGDAALAMAMLYDNRTSTNKGPYNSALRLSKAPDYTNWFQNIPGAGKTRPLIFGTDTSLGLKVAWSGAGGQIPDTVKLGFNRKEFAWAPLSMTPTNVNALGQPDGNAVDVKMPAFLATIQSKQGVGTNGTQIEGMQYFATGDSATYLAMQRDVRAAMIARMDPNTEIYKAQFMKANTHAERTAVIRAMQNVYAGLQLRTDDPVAQAFVLKLDQEGTRFLLNILPEVAGLNHYEFVANTLTIKNNNLSDGAPNNFPKAIRLWSNLEHSVMAVKTAMAANKPGQKIQFQPMLAPGAPAPSPPPQITTAQEAELFDQAVGLQKQFELLDQSLRTNEILVEATDHYVKTVMPR